LRESEKTRAKRQGIDSGSPRVPNQDAPKKGAFQTKIGKKSTLKPEFCRSDDQKACSKVLTEIVVQGILPVSGNW
jgi:hypothetical protein